MLNSPVHREYVRTDNWSVIARAKKDGEKESWFDVRIPNIAAGGLLFLSEKEYALGDVFLFELKIDPLTPGIVTTIPMSAKGVIRGDRGKSRDGLHSYSVEFIEISKSDKIRLDELIRMTNYKFKLDSESDIFDR